MGPSLCRPLRAASVIVQTSAATIGTELSSTERLVSGRVAGLSEAFGLDKEAHIQPLSLINQIRVRPPKPYCLGDTIRNPSTPPLNCVEHERCRTRCKNVVHTVRKYSTQAVVTHARNITTAHACTAALSHACNIFKGLTPVRLPQSMRI